MKCPCRKDCPHRTCNCRPVTLSETASERRRWPCRRLAAPDLTGMRVLKKERFKYAVVCNHGIRRSGVAITEMSGGDRG